MLPNTLSSCTYVYWYVSLCIPFSILFLFCTFCLFCSSLAYFAIKMESGALRMTSFSVCVFVCLFVCLLVCLGGWLFVCLFVWLAALSLFFAWLVVRLFGCLFDKFDCLITSLIYSPGQVLSTDQGKGGAGQGSIVAAPDLLRPLRIGFLSHLARDGVAWR